MLSLNDPEMWQKYKGLLISWGIDEQEIIDDRRQERERARMELEMDQLPDFMPVEEFDAFWEPILADPLDGIALGDLFAEPEPVAEGPVELEEGEGQNWQEIAIDEWDPAPTEWQLMDPNDPVDGFTFPALFDETYVPSEPIREGRPDFSMMREESISRMMQDLEFSPYEFIIDESLPAPTVQIPDSNHLSVLNGESNDIWGKEDEAMDLWANVNGEGATPAWVGSGEGQAVNYAAIKDDLWNDAAVEDITRGLEEVNLGKGKRKAEGDLVDLYTDYTDMWGDDWDSILHLTRSGKFYQPPQLYTGSTSNPQPSANPTNPPTTNPAPPKEPCPVQTSTNTPHKPPSNYQDPFDPFFNQPINPPQNNLASTSRVPHSIPQAIPEDPIQK